MTWSARGRRSLEQAATRDGSAPARPSGAGVGRRAFLKVSGAAGVSVLFSAALGAPTAHASVPAKRRVYVLVVDGCRPDEIGSGLMPNLQALRESGTTFPRAVSLPVMETIPNHVMMMTGVRPDRSGVPANSVYDRTEQSIRDLDRPGDLQFPTVIERLNQHGLTTGTVLSKEYLFGIFGQRATYRWEPGPIVPVSGHAPDSFTVDAAISMVEQFDPDFVFVNLGDCDRMGHADVSGTTAQAARQAALVDADSQVGRFVDMLESSGRWAYSVLLVLADHAMDWSYPDRIVSLQPVFDDDPMLAGNVVAAQNGGADLLYWTGHPDRRTAAVARMREVASGEPGVLSVHLPEELRLGPNAGDLVAYCRAGWRFSDPEQTSNPIPGNHGHPATAPIPFFISGGDPVVATGTSDEAVATVDVAPTVGSLFGIGAPDGGYDGAARL